MGTTIAKTSLRIRAVWSGHYYSLAETKNKLTCYMQIFTGLPSLCSQAVWYELYLVAKPKDWFSRVDSHKLSLDFIH